MTQVDDHGSAGSDPPPPGEHPEHEPEGARPVRRPGPSVRPALIVVGIAFGLVLIFGIGAAVTTGNSPPAARHTGHVHGTSLPTEPASTALRPIELPGTPPPDVLGAAVLPKGVRAVSTTKWDGETQFSAKMAFTTGASQAAIVSFFRAELKARGWSIVDTGPATRQRNATEVLARRASSDGWYWEAGVVVSPTTFTGTTSTESTRFTFELFEVPDAT